MLSNEMQQWIQLCRQSKQASENAVMTPETVIQARKMMDQVASSWPVPAEISVTEKSINGIEGEWYHFTGERPESFNQRVVLFIHGGGFMTGSVKSRRYLCTTALKYGKLDGFSMEYTQYPEGKHPEELTDALHAYRGLQKEGYKAENIYLLGESAGAMMCLMLVLYLKDHDMSMPGKICLYSPVTNLVSEYPSRKERAERDPEISGNINHQMNDFFSADDLHSKYVSTIQADFTGFPKLFVNVGSEEVLYDDSLKLVEKAKVDGVDAQLKVWDGLFHVFTMFPAPESEEALALSGKFFCGIKRCDHE